MRKEFEWFKEQGFDVRQFSEYHFRIDHRFDVFPNDHGRGWSWHDIVTGNRGSKPPEQFKHFVSAYLKANPLPTIQSLTQNHFDVEQGSFKDRLLQIYIADRPFEELWAAVDDELRKVSQ